MFERFTDRARRVLVLAQEEALLLNSDFIRTEHILLGLILEGEGVAAKTLESLGITLEAVRNEAEETIGTGGSSTTGSPPFTRRAKKVLEVSLREALQLGHNHIGTEHMLLGLIQESEGVAAQILIKLGADLSTVRQQVMQVVSNRWDSEESGRAGGTGFDRERQLEDEERLRRLALEHRLVTTEQLREILWQQARSGAGLRTLLVESGLVDEQSLIQVLAEHLYPPVANLRQVTPEPAALDLISDRTAYELVILPLRADDGHLDIVTGDPSEELAQLLAEATGRQIRLFVAPASELRRAIDRQYRARRGVGPLLRDLEALEHQRRRAGAPSDALFTPEDAPVIRLCNLILTEGMWGWASEIDIVPEDGCLRVRFRVDGVLHDVVTLPAGLGPALVNRIKVMAGMNVAERRRLPQDGQFTTDLYGKSVDFRVSTRNTTWGEGCVLGLVDKTAGC